MEKDLELEYPGQIGFVDEIEIRGGEVLVCKNLRNKSVIRKETC